MLRDTAASTTAATAAVVAVTERGHVIAGSRCGSASVLVTAYEEELRVNQSLVILVKVSRCKSPADLPFRASIAGFERTLFGMTVVRAWGGVGGGELRCPGTTYEKIFFCSLIICRSPIAARWGYQNM